VIPAKVAGVADIVIGLADVGSKVSGRVLAAAMIEVGGRGRVSTGSA